MLALDFSDQQSAVFVPRDSCISCGSDVLREVAGGTFADEPLRSYIDSDPWGQNPLPFIEDRRWSLVECSTCLQRFHRFILSPEWNEIRFSRWMSDASIRQFKAEHGGDQDVIRDVKHALRLRDQGVRRVLDYGCGFGEFLEVCRLFGMEAHGVDRSALRRLGAGLHIHSELEHVPGGFDAITLFEVLEHLDDPLSVLKALRSRLNPGGIMVVEVPNTAGVNSISSRSDYYKIHPLDHINAFTPQTLSGMMTQAGFNRAPKPPAFVATSLRQLAKDALRPVLKRRATTQGYFSSIGPV